MLPNCLGGITLSCSLDGVYTLSAVLKKLLRYFEAVKLYSFFCIDFDSLFRCSRISELLKMPRHDENEQPLRSLYQKELKILHSIQRSLYYSSQMKVNQSSRFHRLIFCSEIISI